MSHFNDISSALSVLVVCKDRNYTRMVEKELGDSGHRCEVVTDKGSLVRRLNDAGEAPVSVLLDVGSGSDGLETLSRVCKTWRWTPVIAVSTQPSVGLAVQATKLGAFDVIPKSRDVVQLRKLLEGILLEKSAVRDRLVVGASDTVTSGGPHEILGQSQPVLDILDLIGDVADSDATVLVLGESGTGKELVARAIHHQSRRRARPFVPVNVAALPAGIAESVLFGHERGAYTGADVTRKGWCETADGGTLLLDEIGEMDILLQAKLLRFLQDGTFMKVGGNKLQTSNVRIIAATNRDPQELVSKKLMREDLFYRLNVFPIRTPALRDRREDIPVLVNAFLKRAVETHRRPATSFTPDAMNYLVNYDWPGNIRQLENLVTRMILLTRTPSIDVDCIPAELKQRTKAPTVLGDQGDHRQMEQVEKRAILSALTETSGNAVEAAKILGLGQATIYRKIKRFDIELKDFKPNSHCA